jgi:hypothetical protein
VRGSRRAWWASAQRARRKAAARNGESPRVNPGRLRRVTLAALSLSTARARPRCSRLGLSGLARRRCALDDREENPHSIDIAAVGMSRRGPGYGDSVAVESRPDGSAGLVAVDPPLVGNSANDVQAVVPGRVDHSLVPGAAVVLDFDPGVVVCVDSGSDREGPAGKARAAVLGSVRSEFRGAQDHVIRPRAVIEDYAQVSADGMDVLSAAWIGGLGTLRECSGCWGVHGSSLRRLVHDLCSLERTLSLSTVQ